MLTQSIDKTLLLAKHHLKRGDIPEAQKLYNAVITRFPKNKRALTGLAKISEKDQCLPWKNPPAEEISGLINLYNQGQPNVVIEQANKLTQKYPSSFEVWNILGIALVQVGHLEKATVAFDQLIKINPSNPEGYCNLGNALKAMGQLNEALTAYKKALT